MCYHFSISCFLAWALTACDQSHYCGDNLPNATVTDVLHDTAGGDRLIVGLYHALSYCTGTDEKRFSNERIEVDLATGAVTVDQQASNVRGPLALPDAGYPLYRDGRSAASTAPAASCCCAPRTKSTPSVSPRSRTSNR